MPKDGMIAGENVNVPRRTRNINAEKYTAMCEFFYASVAADNAGHRSKGNECSRAFPDSTKSVAKQSKVNVVD